MKQLLAYTMVLMFLLPTVGLHIDISSCCQTQNTTLDSSVTLNKADCCVPSEHANCVSTEVICVAPTQQSFTAQDEITIVPGAVIELPYVHVCNEHHRHYENPYNVSHAPLVTETSPSFLQVFLC